MRSLTRGEEVRITVMCGRYAQSLGAEAIVEAFDLAGSTLDHSLPLNWNIAPTNEIYIIRSEADSRILGIRRLLMHVLHNHMQSMLAVNQSTRSQLFAMHLEHRVV